eukprot:sb/3463860/
MVRQRVEQDISSYPRMGNGWLYAHLTKRKRSRGIPNVSTWFGMSAVEHLIQNSVNCNSWIWTAPERHTRTPSCSSRAPSTTTVRITPVAEKKETVAVGEVGRHATLGEIDHWDSERSLLDAMSDIGEQLFEGLSPAPSRKGSRKGSTISLADLDLGDGVGGGGKGKKMKGGKLKGHGKKGTAGAIKSAVKGSIISKCRSPRTVRKTPGTPIQRKSNGSAKDDILQVLSDTFTTQEEGSPAENGTGEEEEKRAAMEAVTNTTIKNQGLLQSPVPSQMLEETNNNDNDMPEEKKKAKSRRGGGGGGRFRGGGTMMKCAMFDEVVNHVRKEDEIPIEEARRKTIDVHHGWRSVYRSEMRTKAFEDKGLRDAGYDIRVGKHTNNFAQLESQLHGLYAAHQRLVAARGGRFRGGGTMMKCAMFDEVVNHVRKEDEIPIEEARRKRIDVHHGWRSVYRSEMRTKAFEDKGLRDAGYDIRVGKHTNNFAQLESQLHGLYAAHQRLVAARWGCFWELIATTMLERDT